MDLILSILYLMFLVVVAFIVVIVGIYVAIIVAVFTYYVIKENIKSKYDYKG